MRIVIGQGSCGIAAGAEKVRQALIKENVKVDISITGCIGMCYLEPIVDIYGDDDSLTRLVKVSEKDAKDIAAYVESGDKSHIEKLIVSKEDSEFLSKQTRIALRRCGIINPEEIGAYIDADGYTALKKVVTGMTPEEVIDVIKVSGLAGRGGAGFPTWFKWNAARQSEGEEKYLICNADEGDPGAFMDRAVIESDPHNLIEGMLIGAYAIGAKHAVVYVRAEYPIAVKRFQHAIDQAREYGILGENIWGTGFNFDLHVRLGAGAFVCGEETALLESIEGRRGQPRLKPPFPANEGLWKKPTLINNVETYANITKIILNGAEWYSSIGTEKSKGTKVFALGGDIINIGLVEVPMGTTLREIVFDIGGGIPNGREFKAAQTGGPSGGCIPAEHLDTPIDYESLASIGSMMGSGGLIIMDNSKCMVDIAKFYLDFTVSESCGKCTPCRIGTKRMHEILTKICEGNGTVEDVEKLENLASSIKRTAICGLGQSAPNPVLSTIKYFKDEYIYHVTEQKCRAGSCKALANIIIDPEKCRGCGLCKRNCPVNAISGEIKQPHHIDPNICIKCGTCVDKCPFKAISK
mgnify:CR=1 FL=1